MITLTTSVSRVILPSDCFWILVSSGFAIALVSELALTGTGASADLAFAASAFGA